MSIEGDRPFVVFVSGITPAEIIYGPLLGVVGDEIRAALKDLEVFAGHLPPPDYTIDAEAEGINRVADEAGRRAFTSSGCLPEPPPLELSPQSIPKEPRASPSSSHPGPPTKAGPQRMSRTGRSPKW